MLFRSCYNFPIITVITKKEAMSTPITSIKKPRASTMKSKTVSTAHAGGTHSGSVCRSCHLLPVGAADLMALMLVLVFSLTAVLFTTVYALNLQQAKVAQLETMLSAQ